MGFSPFPHPTQCFFTQTSPVLFGFFFAHLFTFLLLCFLFFLPYHFFPTTSTPWQKNELHPLHRCTVAPSCSGPLATCGGSPGCMWEGKVAGPEPATFPSHIQ